MQVSVDNHPKCGLMACAYDDDGTELWARSTTVFELEDLAKMVTLMTINTSSVVGQFMYDNFQKKCACRAINCTAKMDDPLARVRSFR